jgi:hypothetical protein
MDIPKRSSAGQAVAATELKVIARRDDYRGVLKNSPRRKCPDMIHNAVHHNIHSSFNTR